MVHYNDEHSAISGNYSKQEPPPPLQQPTPPPPPVLRCVSPYQPTFNARHIHIAIMHPQLSDMASF